MDLAGIDIVEIRRIARLVRNRRFCERVFSPKEISYCSSKKNPGQHYAVRFAAKEAVWKALGKKGITHKDISIRNSPEGKPELILPARLKNLEKRISVSLSHTGEYAVAVAVFNKGQ
jgi:holo-[acyl-carrier protein] synthase